MMSFLSALVAVARAIPQIEKMVETFYSMWIDYKVKKLEEYFDLKQAKETYLQKAISNAKDDKERIALSIVLHDARLRSQSENSR